MKHYVYILKCADKTYYTGYTTDISRRVEEHNCGTKGAKYTRGRRPVALIYSEEFSTRSEAQKREYEIKQMSKEDKDKLI